MRPESSVNERITQPDLDNASVGKEKLPLCLA